MGGAVGTTNRRGKGTEHLGRFFVDPAIRVGQCPVSAVTVIVDLPIGRIGQEADGFARNDGGGLLQTHSTPPCKRYQRRTESGGVLQLHLDDRQSQDISNNAAP